MTDSKNKGQDMIEPNMIQNPREIKIEMTTTQFIAGNKTADLVKGPARYESKVDVITDFEKPDYQSFKKQIEDLHPRNKNGKPYTCCEVLCDATSGWHKCINTSQKSELDKFGVGIVQYFRLVKYLSVFFLLATILSIPSIYFCIQTSQEYSGGATFTDFKGVLYLTTLGSISRGASQCFKPKIGDNITLSCSQGTIGVFSTLEYGRVIQDQSLSCDLMTSLSWDKECNYPLETANEFKKEFANCQGQKTCSITIKKEFFNLKSPTCDYWNPDKTTNLESFYFQTLCQNIEIKLPGGTKINKSYVGWIVASLDAGISFLYLIFLLFLKLFEIRTIRNVLGNTESVSDYTIEVKALPKMNKLKLKQRLWIHFSNVLGKKFNVVDVQLAEPNSLLDLHARIGSLSEKKVKMFRNYYNKWSDKKDGAIAEIGFEELKHISMIKGKKAQKDLKGLENLQKSQVSMKKKKEKIENTKKAEILSAFITFEDKSQRDFIYTELQQSPFTRCCFSICCCGYKNDPNVFEGKYLNVKEATDPSNILWSNMDTGNFEKFLRRLLSWGITIALWVLSFACMAFVRNEQEVLAGNVKPNKDCSSYKGLTKELVSQDMVKGAASEGLLECYCREDFDRSFTDDACRGWAIDVLWAEGLPYAIAVAVIIINFVLQLVFRLLSRFEKHVSFTSESISRILKIFVAQALNTGIIILIVNAKFSNHPIPKILDGSFDDVTPQWYLDVAATLCLTMVINVVSLPIVNLTIYSLGSCLKCWDRSCTYKKEKTKKKTQKAWVSLYTGPEFFIEYRYARILTVIFVCLLYSAHIPILYASTFLNLLIIYWIDKFYCISVFFGNLIFFSVKNRRLHRIVRQILILAILLHLGNAVWAYGNSKIYGDSTKFNFVSNFLDQINADQAPGVFARLYERSVQQQNISLSAIFVLVIALIILKLLFDSTLKRMVVVCSRKVAQKIKKNDKYKEKDQYFARIKRDDLEFEKKCLEKEISETNDEQLNRHLQRRLDRVKSEIILRTGQNETRGDKFIGISSYSIWHHPNYKKYFDTKGLVTTKTIPKN